MFPQQTSITSLNNLHSSGFLTEAHRVIYEVPTDLLHTMWINFSIHHGTGFDPRPFHVSFMVHKVTLGQVTTPHTSVYPPALPLIRRPSGRSPEAVGFMCVFKRSTLRGSQQDIKHIVMRYTECYSHANVTFATLLDGAATYELIVSRPSREGKTKNT